MTAVQTSTRAMLAQEYRDVADLLRTLTPQEWETETLCAGWRVRDVVAHVLYEATPALGFGVEIVRSGGGEGRLTRGCGLSRELSLTRRGGLSGAGSGGLTW
uniref:maleylpyruvate isomerase N-terminal domain-containing protein n=1 Tax=Nocardia brasiliensis TaxID=37326 RepID=UPI002454491C